MNGVTKRQQLDLDIHYTISYADDGAPIPALTDAGTIHLQQSLLMAAIGQGTTQ